MAGVAYFVLSRMIIAESGADGTLARAVGRDRKGQISPVLYALYVVVATMWLIPDRRIERLAVPAEQE